MNRSRDPGVFLLQVAYISTWLPLRPAVWPLFITYSLLVMIELWLIYIWQCVNEIVDINETMQYNSRKKFSERVSLGVIHRIRSETPLETFWRENSRQKSRIWLYAWLPARLSETRFFMRKTIPSCLRTYVTSFPFPYFFFVPLFSTPLFSLFLPFTTSLSSILM